MALGDYSPTVWANGTTPAINATNLGHIETKLDEIDNYAGNDRGVLSKTVTTANITLSAAESLNDVIICSGTLTGNRSFIIPTGIKKSYKIIITNTGNYYIRFITASSGTYFDAYGMVSTDETAIQSSYSFDIVTDGTNVYGSAWSIRGSNTNGIYERRSNGLLKCQKSGTINISTVSNVNIGTYGWSYFVGGDDWTFPYVFNSTAGLVVSFIIVSATPFANTVPSTSVVSVRGMAPITLSATPVYMSASGTWK